MLWTYVLWTILLEMPIFLLFWHKEGWWRAMLFCVLLNGFTNPIINLLLTAYGWNVYLMELGVVLTEMLASMLIFRAAPKKALLFSVSANGFSYAMGLVMFALGWLK